MLAVPPTPSQAGDRFDPTIPLPNRVRDTPPNVMTMFREAGMSPRPHELTAAESQLVAQAFAALPPLHQRILREHLRSLSFVEDMPNTALTAPVTGRGTAPLFHLTIRAAILAQTVSAWATEKERTCFDTRQSTLQVTVEAGQRPAFDYVLLHEATHVVDAVLHLTPAYSATGQRLDSATAHSFTAGVWVDRTLAVPAYRDTLLATTRFRQGGRVLPISRAPRVYAALQRTPFVSLYGSCAWTEDLAEYVSMYHFTHKLKQPFYFVVRDKGREVGRYTPRQSALVLRRRWQMKRFYS